MLQTACLTGIYKRIQQLRNILNSMKNCLVSVKSSGNYKSEACKMIFSQYVCQVANDVLMMAMTGCSPLGGKKVLDVQDSDILKYISAGVGGMYEGIDSSINDFDTRYDNSQVMEMLGGGAGGLANKACMAAFGYDWNLNFNGMLDTQSGCTDTATPYCCTPKSCTYDIGGSGPSYQGFCLPSCTSGVEITSPKTACDGNLKCCTGSSTATTPTGSKSCVIDQINAAGLNGVCTTQTDCDSKAAGGGYTSSIDTSATGCDNTNPVCCAKIDQTTQTGTQCGPANKGKCFNPSTESCDPNKNTIIQDNTKCSAGSQCCNPKT